MEIIQLIILYITFLITFIIISFMLLLFGNGRVFNGDDKLRKNIEEFEVAIKRTFDEICNKFADAINIIITKLRRKKWEN